jgi:hypothetical protein
MIRRLFALLAAWALCLLPLVPAAVALVSALARGCDAT